MKQVVVPVPRPLGPQALALAGWLALCFAAAATGALIEVGDWYAALQKPSWCPPAWLFGPFWTLLYIAMATAAWLVWRRGGWRVHRVPLGLFMGQLLLNALWTPLFFGLHRLDLAFVGIVALWMAIAVTLAVFWRSSRTAAVLLAPYLLWVTFAAALNWSLWQRNG